jgi:hypothetical protein
MCPRGGHGSWSTNAEEGELIIEGILSSCSFFFLPLSTAVALTQRRRFGELVLADFLLVGCVWSELTEVKLLAVSDASGHSKEYSQGHLGPQSVGAAAPQHLDA